MVAGANPTFNDEFDNLDLSGSGSWTSNLSWATLDGKNEDGPTLASFYVNPNYGPLNSANPFSDNNGVLDIAANPTPGSIDPSDVNGKSYVSGQLQTSGSFSQLYGYFEMRAELPSGNGADAAFWMVPENGSWPPELDIMESLGQDPSTVYQTVHDGTTADNSQIQQVAAPIPGGNDASGFHTYGVDWEPDTTTFYVDGQQTGRFATPDSMHTPMYMILENDIAGANRNWGNSVDGSTPFPADYKIDYVRAYASMPDLSSGGSPASSSNDGSTPSDSSGSSSNNNSDASSNPSSDNAGVSASGMTLNVTTADGSNAGISVISAGSQTDHPSGSSMVDQSVSGGIDTITASGNVTGETIALGSGTQSMNFLSPGALNLKAGSGQDTITADSGTNQFTAGSGNLTVTGGSGASNFILPAGAGTMTIQDFDAGKGDILTVDQSLQSAFNQSDDGNGGTLLTFGDGQGSIDLVNHPSIAVSDIAFT